MQSDSDVGLEVSIFHLLSQQCSDVACDFTLNPLNTLLET